MNKNPSISICIPTYNRIDSVVKLVIDILQCKCDIIEVVVLDNCSTDGTYDSLKTIIDPRLRVFVNNENIGGPLNQLKVLTLAHGEFAFLCLDKDRISCDVIEKVAERLEHDVVFGFSSLNIEEEIPDVIYGKGLSSILNMAYQSAHPSGMFYRTSFFKELTTLKSIFSNYKKFGFYPDLLNAEMSILGKSLKINTPFFFTESIEECAKIPSFSYDENDVFFSLNKRIEEFNLYVNHLQTLGLSKKELKIVIISLFSRGLNAVTLGFKSTMSNNSICIHYNVKPRKIGVMEVASNYFLYCVNFIKLDCNLSFLTRLELLIWVHVRKASNFASKLFKRIV